MRKKYLIGGFIDFTIVADRDVVKTTRFLKSSSCGDGFFFIAGGGTVCVQGCQVVTNSFEHRFRKPFALAIDPFFFPPLLDLSFLLLGKLWKPCHQLHVLQIHTIH